MNNTKLLVSVLFGGGLVLGTVGAVYFATTIRSQVEGARIAFGGFLVTIAWIAIYAVGILDSIVTSALGIFCGSMCVAFGFRALLKKNISSP